MNINIKEPEYRKESGYQNKTFEITDFKLMEEEGACYIEGYANTKNQPDSYGDIPTNLNGEPVYDLQMIRKNPVAFVDHYMSASNIAGNYVYMEEDEKGLKIKLKLRPLETIYSNSVKDAVSAFMTGYGRSLSIGGKWIFGDPKQPNNLTKAIIYEISLVGVGADSDALCNTIPMHKQIDLKEEQVGEPKEPQVKSVLERASEIKKILKEK